MQGKIDCFGLSDQGKVRRRNEDQFLIADLNKSMRLHQSSLSIEDNETIFGGSQGQLLMVADGVGGHAGGDRASHLAIQTVTRFMLNTMPWFFRLDPNSDEEYREELVAALQKCQQTIAAESAAHPKDAGMGTTLTMGYLIWPRMYVTHIGDSRCYLHRGRKLRQLTKDHTIKQRLIDAGINDEGEDDCELWANTLWNSLGAEADTLPDVFRVDLQLGDSLLFCTDGLTKHVTDDRIKDALVGTESAETVCRSLTQEANDEGGTDNITMVTARFLDSDDAQIADTLAEAASPPEFTDAELANMSTIDQIKIPKSISAPLPPQKDDRSGEELCPTAS
ncbi:MAG: serine/threonine protein phosphatase PrpC [Planctomycetaceae bacterium]|jgi:serine/threonine protein phosphatase PrpC